MAKLKDTSITGNLTVTGNIDGKSNASDLNRGIVPRERLNTSSTSATGIVQLNDNVNSTSTTQAATANAVKKANDNANGRLSLSGGTMTGQLNLTNKSVNPSFGSSKAGSDAASSFPAGLSVFDSGSTTSGWGVNYGTVLNISAGSLDRQCQINIGNNGGFLFRSSHSNNQASSKWGDWMTIYHSGNKPPTIATPRQINGTNFDGSANITTAKWGTARTLTLGGDLSGSVSIDGSSNISLSAQVSDNSHNHTTLNGRYHSSQVLNDHGNGNVTISGAKNSEGTVGDLYLGYNSGSNFTKDILLCKNLKWQQNGATLVDSSGKIPWTSLTGIPASFNPSAHNHDSSYLKLSGGTLKGNVIIDTDTYLEWARNSDYARISFKNTADGDTDSYMCFETGDNGNEYFKFRQKNSSSLVDLMTIKSDHLRFKGERVYHQGYKPTAADVGAVSTGGGTVTGNLCVNQYLQINAWPGYGEGVINLWSNKTQGGILAIDGAQSIVVGGHHVYHTGYKPSPSDIGAAAIEGGRKIFSHPHSPNPTAVGDIWISW